MLQLASRRLLPGQRGERWLAGGEDDRPKAPKVEDVLARENTAGNRITSLEQLDQIHTDCVGVVRCYGVAVFIVSSCIIDYYVANSLCLFVSISR